MKSLRLDIVLVDCLNETGTLMMNLDQASGWGGDLWNTCLRSEGGVILCGGLGTSFVSVYGSKLEVSKGYLGGTLVDISGGDTGVAGLGQEYLM